MDWLTFISKVIDSIAWPTVIVVAVLVLRTPLINLLPLMKKLKYKELELEFSEEVQEIKKELSHSSAEVRTISKEEARKESRFTSLLDISSRAAVLEAWAEVEMAAVEVASSFWQGDGERVFKNIPNLGQYLKECSVIDNNQLEIFNRLREVRNKLAHGQDLNILRKDAESYIESALILAISIRKFNKSIQPTANASAD